MTLTQDRPLNTGYGRCPVGSKALVVAPMSVRMLGEMNDFFATVAAAIHKHNREASSDDFVGMGYPEFSGGKTGLARLGNSVLLVGSGPALEGLLDTERLKRFRFGGGRPVVEDFEPKTDGKAGTAIFTRSRHNERALPGEIARRIRRRERQGKDTANLRVELALSLGEIDVADLPEGFTPRSFVKECFFSIGDKRLAVHCKTVGSGEMGPARVSTYGFSDPGAPLRLPLMPKPVFDSSFYA